MKQEEMEKEYKDIEYKESMKFKFSRKYYKNTRVSLKELREDFYNLRKFEISNLWQRSIFLSAFSMFLFSGYGFLISKLLNREIHQTLIIVFHEICCAISLFGIVFSIIWIMMSKASKSWYEVYESRINDIEKEYELDIPKKYRMTNKKYTPWGLDSNLLTGTGGAYSPSKINILIGQILMFIWTLIFFVHFVLSIFEFKVIFFVSPAVTHTIILVLLIVFILLILITASFNTWAKSSSLTNH